MPTVATFVEELDQALVAAAPTRQHLLKVVVQKCGRKKNSARLLSDLTAALKERGIYARPGLSEATVASDTKITFSRAPSSGWQTGLTFPSERALEDVLVAHHRRIPALSHLRRPRRQFTLPSGCKIDVLFDETGTGDLVVVELKLATSGFGAAGQMFSYIDELACTPLAHGRRIQGLIVTGEPNARMEDQVQVLAEQRRTKVRWVCYRLEVEMAPVFEVDGGPGPASRGDDHDKPADRTPTT